MKTPTTHSTVKAALLAIVGSALCAVSANAANVTYTNADLIIGFRSSDPLKTDSLEIVLGNAGNLRDNAEGFTPININSQLTTVFGAGWATNNTIFWGVVGANTTNGTTVNGDPNTGGTTRTVYFSNTTVTTGFNGADVLPANLSASARSTLSNQIGSFATGTGGLTSATDIGGNAGVVANSSSNSWSGKVVGQASAFGAIDAALLESQLNGSTTYVDLYRSSGNTSVPATYETTFVLSTTGALSATAVAAIPEPSAFAALAGFGAIAVVATRRRRSVA